MTEATQNSSEDTDAQSETEEETPPTVLGQWRIARFRLDAGDVTNTLDLAPPYPFSC
jgi:hypothetical protein